MTAHPPATTTPPSPPHPEWHRDATNRFQRRGGTEVATLLADHLERAYASADGELRLAATAAVERRLAIAHDEKLRVGQRPPGRTWQGDYRLRPKGQALRPWRVRLRGLTPLRASCSCPDFRSASLGVCKHVATVLIDLASRPRIFARALTITGTEPPDLAWDPIKPADGFGDWLERVEAAAAITRREAGRTLWRLTDPATGGATRRLRALSGAQRGRAVEALHDLLRPSAAADPALQALVDDERDELRRRAALATARSHARRHLASLRRKLLDFQVTAIRRITETGPLVLADDMGLGKTTQAIAAIHLLARCGLVRRALVVAPAALKAQWEQEWQATTDLDVSIVDGDPTQRAAAYRGNGFRIANYEQLLRDVETVRAWRPDLVVLDEGQRIKNWATRTARVVKRLHPEFRIVLTGTPFENRITELDSILEWVDRRPLQPLWRLAPLHGLQDRDSGGVRGLGVLRQRLDPVVLRRRRADVIGELPQRTDHVIPVEMTAAQLDAHDALNEPIVRLMRIAERRPLTQEQFLKLMSLLTTQRVIANGLAQADFPDVEPQLAVTAPTTRNLGRLDAPKLTAIRDLLEALAVDQGRKVVVFSQWRRMLHLVEWACGPVLRRHGVQIARFVGGQSARQRRSAVVAFHDDPAVRILLATDAGGVGLNLQRAANACVQCDLPWNPAVFEQRVARIHRMGQRQPIDVYALVSQNCIEERIHRLVQRKQAVFSGLFDGDSDEVRFDESSGFLDSVRKLVDANGSAADSPASDDPDDDRQDPIVAELTEHADESRDRTATDAAAPRGDLASALAGLEVERRNDGSLRIEARPEAARLLSAALRALATTLDPD